MVVGFMFDPEAYRLLSEAVSAVEESGIRPHYTYDVGHSFTYELLLEDGSKFVVEDYMGQVCTIRVVGRNGKDIAWACL